MILSSLRYIPSWTLPRLLPGDTLNAATREKIWENASVVAPLQRLDAATSPSRRRAHPPQKRSKSSQIPTTVQATKKLTKNNWVGVVQEYLLAFVGLGTIVPGRQQGRKEEARLQRGGLGAKAPTHLRFSLPVEGHRLDD